MVKLADIVTVHRSVSRSANVERDRDRASVAKYVPTSRALELLSRLAAGMMDSSAGRTFSVTGPHGGGKSSFAVFLRALMSERASGEFTEAHRILTAADAGLARTWMNAVRGLDPTGAGFWRAFATAGMEPVSDTISRALASAVPERSRVARRPHAVGAVLTEIQRLSNERPLIIVVDEFGKNLQAYAASGQEGDPYLLQQIAELSQGTSALPVIVITMQHLSFDEYVTSTSSASRREWAKVQGRFQDFPYVETAQQTWALAAATVQAKGELPRVRSWQAQESRKIRALSLNELSNAGVLIYPLHPLVLAILPELCSRYGQNERTLFSFLTGHEPLALPQFLAQHDLPSRGALPVVELDRVYDYFIDSAGTALGAADRASRWLEIEVRVRDALGLSPLETRVLKTIGVLNLVSAGGSVRASQDIVRWALSGSSSEIQIDAAISSLEEAGLVVHRKFSDEYRMWEGTDVNLRELFASARIGVEERSLADLLNDVAALEPSIAGRHSVQRGVLRIFARSFAGQLPDDAAELDDPGWDGQVVYLTGAVGDLPDLAPSERPVIVVEPSDLDNVRAAAEEVAVIVTATRAVSREAADRVALQELHERRSYATQRLQAAVAQAWSPQAARWILINDQTELDARQGLSHVLSEAADASYKKAPKLANEMIARRDLTSQGAKARRMLIDSMVAHPNEEQFGIVGYPAERAIYEALFRSTGLHRRREDGSWALRTPHRDGWGAVWRKTDSLLSSATHTRVNLSDVEKELSAPPFGLKRGVIPIMLVASLLMRGDEIALYEHGTLVLKLDDAVTERLARNPDHFTVKNLALDDGARGQLVAELARVLQIDQPNGLAASFLQVAQALFRRLQTLPPFTQKTVRNLSDQAKAVRRAFQLASEPDVLIFEQLPEALGFPRVEPGQAMPAKTTKHLAKSIGEVIAELTSAYDRLLEQVEREIAMATGLNFIGADLHEELAAQASAISGKVLEPKLRAMFGAAQRDTLEHRAWLENLAMVVAEGRSPRSWDDVAAVDFQTRIAELGGAMRRMLALFVERQASIGRDKTRRITVTRPDGSETSELLMLTDHERRAVERPARRLLAGLVAELGDQESARRAVLAWLVEPTTDIQPVPGRLLQKELA